MPRSLSLTADSRRETDSAPRGRSVLYVTDSKKGLATARARGAVYARRFEQDGWTVRFLDAAVEDPETIVEAARSHDAVMLLKVASYPLVRALRDRTRAALVFDLTDSLWQPSYRAEGWHDLERILRAADAVFCENDTVRAFGSRHNPRVHVLPTCAQVELFDAARASAPPRPADRVVIGWLGSRSTSGALEKIKGPLARLCARHPRVELRFVGADARVVERLYGGTRHSGRAEYTEADMVREMLAFDIGVFPVPFDLEDYRVRGPLKALLYMAAGVPAVCQDAGDCSRLIRDGVDGMLADSEAEWESKLEALVLSADLRRRMGEAGLARARDGHTLSQAHAAVRDALESVIRSSKEASVRRPLSAGARAGGWMRAAGFRAGAVLFKVRRRLAGRFA